MKSKLLHRGRLVERKKMPSVQQTGLWISNAAPGKCKICQISQKLPAAAAHEAEQLWKLLLRTTKKLSVEERTHLTAASPALLRQPAAPLVYQNLSLQGTLPTYATVKTIVSDRIGKKEVECEVWLRYGINARVKKRAEAWRPKHTTSKSFFLASSANSSHDIRLLVWERRKDEGRCWFSFFFLVKLVCLHL